MELAAQFLPLAEVQADWLIAEGRLILADALAYAVDQNADHLVDLATLTGAITAAKLLERFVGNVPWAHLDIAGPAWAEHECSTHDSGGTGCFVRRHIP